MPHPVMWLPACWLLRLLPTLHPLPAQVVQQRQPAEEGAHKTPAHATCGGVLGSVCVCVRGGGGEGRGTCRLWPHSMHKRCGTDCHWCCWFTLPLTAQCSARVTGGQLTATPRASAGRNGRPRHSCPTKSIGSSSSPPRDPAKTASSTPTARLAHSSADAGASGWTLSGFCWCSSSRGSSMSALLLTPAGSAQWRRSSSAWSSSAWSSSAWRAPAAVTAHTPASRQARPAVPCTISTTLPASTAAPHTNDTNAATPQLRRARQRSRQETVLTAAVHMHTAGSQC